MRARFTIDDIADAALRMVDEGGLGGLSMRSLATALGTGPMTLYNYVRDKEALEELVVSAVIAKVRIPEPSGEWRRDVREIASAMWQAVRAHPAAIPLVLTRRSFSAASFAAADALIAALRAVLGFVVGAAQAELAGPLGGVERSGEAHAAATRIGALAGADYPHI